MDQPMDILGYKHQIAIRVSSSSFPRKLVMTMYVVRFKRCSGHSTLSVLRRVK